MFLSSGQPYVPGEGAERASRLPRYPGSERGLELTSQQAKASFDAYGPAPSADAVVADLIDRGLISHREVALALLLEGAAR